MKNIKIYPKDWMQLHPYKQSTPVDSYYTHIANRIYDIMEETGLANSFEREELLQVCTRMAAYFEDVISGLNIWRAFLLEYKHLFGKQLPFYTPDDHYYDDEVNYEDIRLLLWHFTQQYHGARKGTFVSPDNIANGETARLIYQLFCDEWTTAPENERMQALFAPETRYDSPEKYSELLSWFHYDSYWMTDSKDEVTETYKAYCEEHSENKDNIQAIMMIHESLAHISRTHFLAYTSPKWLSLILPETHPDYALFAAEAEKSENFTNPEMASQKELFTAQYERFVKYAEGHPLVYLNNRKEFFELLDHLEIAHNEKESPDDNQLLKAAVYATPEAGLQVLQGGIEYLKDERNPFYDKKKATDQALSFFIVNHCRPFLLKELETRGMLADAQTKSLTSPERGKAIIHENWEYLMRYFHREYK